MTLTDRERRQIIETAKGEVGLRKKLTPMRPPRSRDPQRQALIDRTLRFYRRFYRPQRVEE